MPPKAAKAAADTSKTFSAEVLATILAASGTVIGGKHYTIMAQLDDSKTASAWEHAFRPIKARAKEITAKMEGGEFGDLGATPAKPAGGKKMPTKRARKSKEEDVGESPTKKMKRETTGSGSDADAPGSEVAD